MSHEARVKIPVQCATCKATTLVEFPVVVVVTALTVWNNMRLYTKCHEVSWSASPAELSRIRAHLGSSWIEQQRALVKTTMSEFRKNTAIRNTSRVT